jgi:3-oxoacyl-[acyl-carrier protein] reductase
MIMEHEFAGKVALVTEGARAFGISGTEAEARLIAATALEKRPGRPSDLSPVALFLASAASGWMTGGILSVAGGLR